MDDAKYLLDGTEVEVISETKDGRFVISEMYCDDEGCYPGETKIVDRVFDEPPTKIYSEEVLKLQAEIEALEDRRREIKREIEDAGKSEPAVVTQLRDLLIGKYTHALVVDGGWMEIIPIEKLKTDRDGKYFFALTGYLRPEYIGYWSWKSNYNDYHREIRLCRSRDDALIEAQKYIDETTRRDGYWSNKSALVDFAITNGLRIPQKAIDERRREEIKSIEHNIDYHRKSAQGAVERIEYYQKQLEEVEARYTAYAPTAAPVIVDDTKDEIPF